MAKKRKVTSRKKVYKNYKSDDKLLMLLAGATAILVAFVAIASYRSQSLMLLPSSTPNQIKTVKLDAQNGSEESGTATLQEVDGKVVVTLNLTGYSKGVTQPAHIHLGRCPNPGAIKYPLTSVVNGASVTTINTTLSGLMSLGDLAINVHKSVPQSNIYYSCGDLK